MTFTSIRNWTLICATRAVRQRVRWTCHVVPLSPPRAGGGEGAVVMPLINDRRFDPQALGHLPRVSMVLSIVMDSHESRAAH